MLLPLCLSLPGTKTTSEVVDFYYRVFKKSSHYQIWKARKNAPEPTEDSSEDELELPQASLGQGSTNAAEQQKAAAGADTEMARDSGAAAAAVAAVATGGDATAARAESMRDEEPAKA